MAAVHVAELIIDDSIEYKLRHKEKALTGTQLREAVLFARDATMRWHSDPEHGRRLVVRGSTYAGIPIIAYLVPIDED